MGLQEIAQLHDEIRRDPQLAQRLDGTSPADLARELVAIGRERGYQLDHDEVVDLLESAPEPASGELSDEDLEGVAGGASWGSGSVANKLDSALKVYGSFDESGVFIQTDTFPR